MAPSRGRGRGRGARNNAPGSARKPKAGNPFRTPEDIKLEPYKELLRAEAREKRLAQEPERPLKRRRVGPPSVKGRQPSPAASAHSIASTAPSVAKKVQTVTTDASESEAEDEDWEEVGLKEEKVQDSAIADIDEEEEDKNEPLSIVVQDDNVEPVKTNVRRRRPVTSAERQARVEIHKLHLLCLVAHVFRRNHWCNDTRVQAALKHVAPPKLITMVHPDPNTSQMQASKSFTDGLIQLASIWDSRYRMTARGVVRPYWQTDEELQGQVLQSNMEGPLDKSDFIAATKSFEGSADLGAQLFCAMLRAIGLEARLACSLQVLPFTAAGAPPLAATVPSEKTTIYAMSSEEDMSDVAGPSPQKVSPEKAEQNGSRQLTRIRRLGDSKASSTKIPDRGKAIHSFKRPKRLPRPAHPVYWVEVLNHAYQKWVAVDPHATQSVGRPSKLEPAINDPDNAMTYVLAFEEDGSARDVTQRYTKAFNAKTRRQRVEVTPDGPKWYSRALSLYKRRRRFDRDQVEDAELAKKEASEGMPRNVQDFKDHPYYALERHLKRNEVIHPKNESGRLNVGTATKPRFEMVYRRKDVHTVRTADKWFRFGREIKDGELPLKVAAAASARRRSAADDAADEDEEQEDQSRGLYAVFQTELYLPPPVIAGQVPKNAYGNIDVYVPSMIPAGGVHIRHAEAKYAARQLNIDYADAVTGFQFKGRHGTAVVQGVIIAAQYQEAIEAVIQGMQDVREDAVNKARSFEALRLWKTFLIGLRIRERVNEYKIPGQDDGEKKEEEDDDEDEDDIQAEIDAEMRQYDERAAEEEGGGGFFFEPDEQPARPTASGNFQYTDQYEGGGFLPDDDEGGGFMIEDTGMSGDVPNTTNTTQQGTNGKPHTTTHALDEAYDEHDDLFEGGGFLPDEDPVLDPQGITPSRDQNGMPVRQNDQSSPSIKPRISPELEVATTRKEDAHQAMNDLAQPTSAITAPDDELDQSKSSQPISSPSQKEPASSDEDAGSLPSHISDEEDADADWVL